jgi:hypothetical protein
MTIQAPFGVVDGNKGNEIEKAGVGQNVFLIA